MRAVQETQHWDGASHLDLQLARTLQVSPVSLAWLPLSLALRAGSVWTAIWQLDISATSVSKHPSLSTFLPWLEPPYLGECRQCESKMLPGLLPVQAQDCFSSCQIPHPCRGSAKLRIGVCCRFCQSSSVAPWSLIHHMDIISLLFLKSVNQPHNRFLENIQAIK